MCAKRRPDRVSREGPHDGGGRADAVASRGEANRHITVLERAVPLSPAQRHQLAAHKLRLSTAHQRADHGLLAQPWISKKRYDYIKERKREIYFTYSTVCSVNKVEYISTLNNM